MKRMILTLLLTLLLVGCGNEEEPYEVTELTFNNQTYQYMKTEDDYEIFVNNNGHTIEVKYGETTILTTEIDDDIYIITGTKTEYEIQKNGTVILICTGEEINCTGFENVDFREDIISIINEYEKE